MTHAIPECSCPLCLHVRGLVQGAVSAALSGVTGSALLTYAQAGERLGVSESSVSRLVQAGDLPVVRVSDTIRRIDPADLARYIDERRHGTAPTVPVTDATVRTVFDLDNRRKGRQVVKR